MKKLMVAVAGALLLTGCAGMQEHASGGLKNTLINAQGECYSHPLTEPADVYAMTIERYSGEQRLESWMVITDFNAPLDFVIPDQNSTYQPKENTLAVQLNFDARPELTLTFEGSDALKGKGYVTIDSATYYLDQTGPQIQFPVVMMHDNALVEDHYFNVTVCPGSTG